MYHLLTPGFAALITTICICIHSPHAFAWQQDDGLNVYFSDFKLSGTLIIPDEGVKRMVTNIGQEFRAELERQLIAKNRKFKCRIEVLRKEKYMNADFEYLSLSRSKGIIQTDTVATIPEEAQVLVMGYIRLVPGVSEIFLELSVFYRNLGKLQELSTFIQPYSGDLRKLEDDLLRGNFKIVDKIAKRAFSATELNNMLEIHNIPGCFPNLASDKIALATGSLFLAGAVTTGVLAETAKSGWQEDWTQAQMAVDAGNFQEANDFQDQAEIKYNRGKSFDDARRILQYPALGLLLYATFSYSYKVLIAPKRRAKQNVPVDAAAWQVYPSVQPGSLGQGQWQLNLQYRF